ncbi:glycosyltransferase [Streptomyces sp. NBC_00444]|uniref:glycosyltransferase n=1 Tax=Streptomyces sp. NBC_00444 TaxID=2975744 RepID=UPI002E1AABD2
MTWFAITLAVLNSWLFAEGTRLQHSTCAAPLPLISACREPRWLAGLALIATGAGLQVAALQLAPVTVVQPAGVLGLAGSVAWQLRMRGTWPGRPTAGALVAIVVGAGAFAVLAATHTVPTPITTLAQVQAGVGVAAVALTCHLAARVLGGRRRCLMLSVGAGAAYGYASVLGRAAIEHYSEKGVSPGLLGTLAGAVAAVLTGFGLLQRAYADGPPETTTASVTITDPLVAVVIGVALLGEAPALTASVAGSALACAALAVAGVIALSRDLHAAVFTPYAPPAPVAHPPAQEPRMSFPPRRRIVIAADTYPPDVNGAANFAHRLAAGLAGRGHDVHVICPAPHAGAREVTADGVTVHRLVSHRTPFHPTIRVCLPWQIRTRVTELLNQLAPDVVHAQSHFCVGRTAISAARAQGIPVVATNHFMPENLIGFTRLRGRLAASACAWAWRDLARVFRHAQIVTAPTPRAARLLAERELGHTALAVSCGLDLARFAQPARPKSDSTLRVLFVGRLDAEKNVHELLRAVALLPAHHRVQAEIVGDGSCRAELQNLARTLCIADRVTFHGLISDQEVLEAYARCDVFCMPGTAELQSLVTMEAMAAGKPVVAAAAMALPHLVHHGHNGCLYPPGDIAALTAALASVLDDAEERVRMGEASRTLIAEHDITHTLTAFEGLYEQAARVLRGLPTPRLPATAHPDWHGYAANSDRWR